MAEHPENYLCMSSEDHVTTYRGNKKTVFDAKPGWVKIENLGLNKRHGDLLEYV